MSFFEEY